MFQSIGSELHSNMTGELPSFIKAHFWTEKKAEAFIINAVVEALASQERENTGSFLELIKKISCVQPSQSNNYHQEGSFSTCSEKHDEALDNESGATAEVNALRQDLEQKQLELTALEEKLKEAHQEINKLTLNVRAHAQTIDKLITEKREVLAAEKQAHYELKYQYQNLETRYNSSEEVCASLRSELAIEKQAHEDTCNVLATEKQAHKELKDQYQNLETLYSVSEEFCASLRVELATEKQAHQVTRDQIRIYLSNIEAERNTVSANREKWREEYQQLETKFLAKEQSEQEWKKQQDNYEQERIQLKTYLVQSEAERNELAMLCQNLRAENKQLRDAKEKNN